jgi:hypothetical protein
MGEHDSGRVAPAEALSSHSNHWKDRVGVGVPVQLTPVVLIVWPDRSVVMGLFDVSVIVGFVLLESGTVATCRVVAEN